VPPLRARGPDIRLLATRFIEQFGRRYGKPETSFTQAALQALDSHTWPGNVRELRNFIEQAVLLAQDAEIDAADLLLPKAARLATGPFAQSAADGLELAPMERDLILQALEKTSWNATQAAKILGISRDTLRYRMEKHRLARET
jgi:DNA-binding NtrC family response regulator